MSRRRPILIILAIVAVAAAGWWLLGPGPRKAYLSGYIVGDGLHLSAPVSGTIASIDVIDGQRVAAGQPLFRIAPATLEAQGDQAAANIRATLTQVASAEAGLRQAQSQVSALAAAAERARRDLARLESVRRDDPAAVAGKDLDAARAALREAEANVASAQKAADARRAEIGQAQAQAQQARGGQRGVQIQVSQLSPTAPAAGRVQTVYYQQGEWVAANQPIVTIIPDNKVKIRFFVPEGQAAKYRPGEIVKFSCDSCAAGLEARIGYVSPEAEFTPPIIFSRDSRDRLVFMVEAFPSKPGRLKPGLPVEVEPLP